MSVIFEIVRFEQVVGKGALQGFFDIQISKGKSTKTYRNLSYWQNPQGKKWINPPQIKREEKWINVFEFDTETFRNFSQECMEALKIYFDSGKLGGKGPSVFD